jgi:uncharacterized protein (DUF58 family)
LTAFLAILVLTAVIATASGYWLLFRASYVIAFGIPIAFAIAWFNTRAIRVEVDRRTLRAQVGQEASEYIQVYNRWYLPKLWIEVDDPSDMPGHESKRILVIPGMRNRSWYLETTLLRRGLYDWGPVRVVSSDPFGIFHLERRFGGQEQILVYPPVQDLPNFQTPPASLPGEGRFRRRTHYVTPNASGVREYAPGDPWSRIHWRSTARTGDLMVKTFELDPASDIFVILDLEESVQAGSGDDSTEEYGVRVAASVARHYLNANRSVGLISFGEDLEIIEPERGQGHLTRILESLAMAKGVGEASLGDLISEEQRRFGRHTTVVVVTSSNDDSWLPTIQSLHQRGVRVAVVLVDAGTFGGDESPIVMYGELAASNILTYMVRNGDDLSLALSTATTGADQWQS